MRTVDVRQSYTQASGAEGATTTVERAYGWAAEEDNPSFHDSATGLVAAGSAQGDALAIGVGVSLMATVTSGTGVRLPSVGAGKSALIRNGGANTLSIYPASGGTIDGGSADAAITLATAKAVMLFSIGANTWVSLPGA